MTFMKHMEVHHTLHLTNSFKNQFEEAAEANERSWHFDQVLEGESFHRFVSITQITKKLVGYQDIKSTNFCKVHKLLCTSNTVSIIQIVDSYCLLWCISAHKNKVQNYRERESHYAKLSHEPTQCDIQFPKKMKDKPTNEQMTNLKIDVFEVSLSFKNRSPDELTKIIMKKTCYFTKIVFVLILIYTTFVSIKKVFENYADDV